MKGKIILEEHICMPEQDHQIARFDTVSHNGKDLFHALIDLHDRRLEEMNANGIEFAIISQNPAGPQSIHDAGNAGKFATRANDYLAELVGRRPERFGAFACLAMHDAAQAATELERCVRTLGMFGAMLNGGQEYKVDGEVQEWQYDEPKYEVFWAKVQELGVPVYLHPKSPLPADMDRLYGARPWLIGPTYSFARDCSYQVMALCTSGLFDKFPGVRIIVGHMGEMILHHLGRIDHWLEKRNRGYNLPSKKTLREYFEQNLYITTAGIFSTPTLIHAITEIGVGRIMFSIDTPYEDVTEGATWIDTLPISHTDVAKIGRNNAMELLPGLTRVLRTTETGKLQTDRQRTLFRTNPGFE